MKNRIIALSLIFTQPVLAAGSLMNFDCGQEYAQQRVLSVYFEPVGADVSEKLSNGVSKSEETRALADFQQLGLIGGKNDILSIYPTCLDLFNAISKHDLNRAQAILNAGVLVDCRVTDQGPTPLATASYGGLVNFVKLLISQGADVNTLTAWYSPLSAAVLSHASESAILEIVNLLITKGADVNDSADVSSPLMRSDDLKVMKALIAAGANVNKVGLNGRTALMLAAEKYSADIVQLLVSSNAYVNAQDDDGNSVLRYAAIHQNIPENELLRIFEILFSAGADANLTERSGSSPLIDALAIFPTQPKHVIQILIQKTSNVNLADKNGRTALSYASEHASDVNIASALVLAGSDINTMDSGGNTPLHYAVLNDNLITGLLLQSGAKPDAINKHGQNPLMFSMIRRDYDNLNQDSVEAFFKAGFDINRKDNSGMTVLMYTATISPQINAPQYLAFRLVQLGANKELMDNRGRTAYDIAVENFNLWPARISVYKP